MKKTNRPIRITKLFFRSSVKLGSSHGKQLANFVEDLSESGVTPGMRPHPLGEFLSLSPNMELRVLADDKAESIVLVYVDKHDAAYRWACQHTILRGNQRNGQEFYEIVPMTLDATGTNTNMLMTALSSKMAEYGFPESLCVYVGKLCSINELKATVWMFSPEWQECINAVVSEVMARIKA